MGERGRVDRSSSSNPSRRTFIGLGIGAGLAGAGLLTTRPSVRASPSGAGRWSTPSGIRSTPSIRPCRTRTPSRRLLNSFLDPLVWQPEAGKFFPGLATSWQVSPDATRYTFTLREKVKFHDGTPFNGAAVKATFDRVVDPQLKALLIGLAGPIRRHGRPGRPPDPGEVQGAVPALSPLPERDRSPARVSDRRQEVGRRLRPEPGGHRPVRAHEVLPVGDRLRALRRLQLGAGVPRSQGTRLSRPAGPAPRSGGVDAASSRWSAASRS